MSDETLSPRRYRLGLTAAALLSVLLRLRFVFTPISADEGGFLAIARAWRHGRDLYGDVWVDRPQGLVVVYRLYDVLSFGHTGGLRVIALVFGAVAVVAVADAVRVVATPAAGLTAGVLVAVMSSAPAIEGFAANGELLSGTLSAVSLAVGCAVLAERLPGRWMVVAGVLGGCGFSLKQSGVDGPLAVGLWLVVVLALGWMPRRTAALRLGQLAGGAAGVIGLLALHGLLTGWDQWWYAIVGYRKDQRSALVGADWTRLDQTWLDARVILLPAAVAAVMCAILLWGERRSTGRSTAMGVLLVWPLTGLFSFLLGGQFFHHYWVILTFPMAALTGLFIGSVPWRTVRTAALVLALLPPLWSFTRLAALPRDDVPVEVSGYARATKEERVGHWFAAHAAPGETFYVLCASAAAYAHAHADPPYPYLWSDNVHQVPGALPRLEAMLSGPDRPTYVAVFQSGRNCGSARVDGLLADDYHEAAVVDGVRVLRSNGTG